MLVTHRKVNLPSFHGDFDKTDFIIFPSSSKRFLPNSRCDQIFKSIAGKSHKNVALGHGDGEYGLTTGEPSAQQLHWQRDVDIASLAFRGESDAKC